MEHKGHGDLFGQNGSSDGFSPVKPASRPQTGGKTGSRRPWRPSDLVTADGVISNPTDNDHDGVPAQIEDGTASTDAVKPAKMNKSVRSYNTGYMSDGNYVKTMHDVRKIDLSADEDHPWRWRDSPSAIILTVIGVVIVLFIVKALFF
jgi:hypothetical protein